jgi:hypothetical protein
MLLLLLACRPGAPSLLSVTVAADQSLSLDIQWAASDAAELTLERVLPDGTVLTDAVSPSGGTVRAHGHPALSVVTVSLVTDEGARSEEIAVETGNLTPGVPAFSAADAPLAAGELLLISTSLLHTDDLADVTVALDSAGRVVWFHEEEDVRIYRPDLLVEADGWWGNRITSPLEDGSGNTLTRLDWSGGEVEVRSAPESHHVFASTPRGLAWPVEDVRTIDGVGFIGDTLLLDDEPIFSVWEDLDAAALIDNAPPSMGPRFSHTNGLFYDAGDDRLLLTLGAQAAVLELDAASGEPLRWLGSEPPPGIGLEAIPWSEAEAMVLPHMASLTASGTLLLTGSSADFTETWATEFSVTDEGLVPVWSHGRGEALGTPALGHATRLPGGDTLVNFGTRGVIQRVSAEGEVLGSVSVELGRIFGRSVVTGPIPLTVLE